MKMRVVCHLGLRWDCWNDFLKRNNFDESSPPQVDKPVVSESKLVPPVPYSALRPKPLPEPPVDLLNSVTKDVENVKPMAKNSKTKPNVNSKGKTNPG